MGEHESSSSRDSSSYEKIPRNDHEYPLEVLGSDNDPEDEFSPVARGSAESARAGQEQSTTEPLLPIHHQSKASKKCSFSLSGIWAWVKGPAQPRKYHITPLLPRWQAAPARLIERYFRSTVAKGVLLLSCLILWGAVFVASLNSTIAGSEISGYGNPIKLSCHSRLWSNATDCGLNGDDCRPFDDGAFAFRCPAGCSAAMVLEPYIIGPQEINYRSLVIGGGDGDDYGVYRGDSAICQAALHAGLTTDAHGGCGILRRTGEQRNFPSVEKNGIASVAFPSNFPLSFTFGGDESSANGGFTCQDIRWPLFGFSVAVSTILSLSIASPAAFYASMFFIVYFQVALSSDPPYSPDYYEIVSIALGRFLPCAFVGFALYYFCVRHTLKDLHAHWDKTILWLGPCWVGALNNDTFDRIPISRLTPHDIQQQPGALPALIIIVALLCVILFTQAIGFRNEGRLPAMLAIYGVLLAIVLVLLAVPHMNLRIHHYILSLLFLPGTTLQTRPSLLYSGLLVGLFINGIARWGFDSILQTPGALLNGAQLGSALPHIAAPLLISATNIIFAFPDLDKDADGISVLVNDVERFQAFKPREGAVESFNWTRWRAEEPEYFRFGFIKVNALGGIWYEDFTKPVVWDADGRWNQSDSGS
ncbi:LCCL domain-containing protein [Aspergillus clavatus NRRL 1]|uniref:LCCL domain protein n=1 Tax=Aspergillus clavatus (strain ATCC 1007 / CBS 513.65 / DSM 816 / NCTC 3887 / NRRL 1 / QM 1276 / 107) TaxID=344612 RepID=A1CAJ5_ASPCL|nr:LCCL domain protein [Aspergillus clavatus NRRL 1]EAW12763.1 LCCL domain protein [Aspergillus clavatus NRRL 1]